jgi:uncharacterized protein YecE (DUF72 family)
MLPYYAERFATTEINYSFRHIPSVKTLSEWDQATPQHFRFSFKAPQKITHWARLRDCTDTVEFFNAQVSSMDEKLGVVLYQLPPDFTCDVDRLKNFLESLPQIPRVAFEFRHESWFDEAVFTALREHNAALCIAESESVKTPAIATADFGYLRLRQENYSAEDISRWAMFVQSCEKEWADAFVYFKHEESGAGPKLAVQMMDLLTAAVPGAPT